MIMIRKKSGSGPQHRYHIRRKKNTIHAPSHHPLQPGELATLPLLALHYGIPVRDAIIKATNDGLECFYQEVMIRASSSSRRTIGQVKVWRIP